MKTTTLVVSLLIVSMNGSAVLAQSFDGEPAFRGSGSAGWPRFSFDYSNSNHNPFERTISRRTAPRLERAWQTFNDSQWRPGSPPTGFALEGAVNLRFRSTVVGVVSPPLVIDGTIYYVDELGTMFARDAKTGTITDGARHWTTTLVDPDYAATPNPIVPDLYYTAPVATPTHIWIRSSINGRVHAVRRMGGMEEDFDPDTPGVQPYRMHPDEALASNLGEPVIVELDANGRVVDGSGRIAQGHRVLLISEQNVILKNVLLPGGQAQTGVITALANHRSAASRGVLAHKDDRRQPGDGATLRLRRVGGIGPRRRCRSGLDLRRHGTTASRPMTAIRTRRGRRRVTSTAATPFTRSTSGRAASSARTSSRTMLST